VASVAFFANGVSIGSDPSSPFSISWSPAASGSYSLTAVATDNQGATTTSAAVAVTVTLPNVPPTASLTAPANGAVVSAGVALTLTASASDSDGTVTSVAFQVNGSTIATDTTSPFSTSWTPSIAGSTSLTAV